ncbi:uncharacterized protein LOC126738284 isoform X2 [Anthonomus grandis grandis]|uniref:uncharacterized protein LOC126738284 isoform X2 n=1 Tax=Anthonomus grandis grandis TaxID=2921223 RepID=UPI002165189A|nr:uncharacterized protein LOC126738284 isoform X2 [Anthonomus grandis grandis]
MFLRNSENKILKLGINVVVNKGKKNFSREIHDRAPPNGVNVQRIQSVDFVRMALENVKIEKLDDWEKLKQSILNHELNRMPNLVNHYNVDARIMGTISILQRLDLSRSYLKYLESQNIRPNLATLGKYLKFLYESIKQKASKSEETEILSICDNLRKTYPVLDSISLESIVLALSVTSRWKECIDIMTEIKKTTRISTPVYTAVASAAFLNKENELAWEIINDALSENKLPQSGAYISFLKRVKLLRKQENIHKQLETMFKFLGDSAVNCQEEVVDHLIGNFHIGSKTKVNAKRVDLVWTGWN